MLDKLAPPAEETARETTGAWARAFGAALAHGDERALSGLFAADAPARRAARLLLGAGPLVGGCWAALLVNTRAWDWPVPELGKACAGLLLVSVIALLAIAACTDSYQRAQRAATLACVGLIALDSTLGTAMFLPAAAHGWLMVLAAAGCARISFAARSLRRIHAH